MDIIKQETYGINLISIIVPVYNVEKYLVKCIDSILNQTYKNMELILVNDGSTDDCAQICDYYATIDSRIIVVHQKNNGVTNARNVGIEMAKGDYIAFVDSDDWIAKDMYDKLIRKLEFDGSDICVGGIAYENYSGEKIHPNNIVEIFEEKKKIIALLEEKKFTWSLCDKVYRSMLFENLKLNNKIKNGEDLLANWYLFHKANKVSYIPLYSYFYCKREDSAMNAPVSENKLSCIEAIIEMKNKAKNSFELNMINRIYCSRLTYFGREMLMFDCVKYEIKIKKIQREIRRNIRKFLLLNNLSIRVRLGVMYFCMPYQCCVLLKKMCNR